jgi:hypothetical protein
MTETIYEILSVDEIKKMKELFDCGTITQKEFDAFKKNAKTQRT